MQVCKSQAIVSALFKASSIISNKLLATPFTTDCNVRLSGSQRKWYVRIRFLSPTLLILICSHRSGALAFLKEVKKEEAGEADEEGGG